MSYDKEQYRYDVPVFAINDPSGFELPTQTQVASKLLKVL